MKPIRNHMRLFLALGWLGMLTVNSDAQNTVLPTANLCWDYSESRAHRSSDGSKLDIILSIKPALGLKGQEMVCIYPTYVAADGRDSVKLEPVYILGRKRFRVIKRRKALHNLKDDQHMPRKVFTTDDVGNSPLTFKNSFPFERWMSEGYIVVKEKRYGCAGCGISAVNGRAIRTHIPLFGPNDYGYSFIEPVKVMTKSYSDSFDCKVTFPVARYDLQMAFANNRWELSGLEKFIQESLNIKGASLKGVYIKGYSSPEGNFSYNKELAYKRTLTLSDYVTSKYPILKKAENFQLTGVGEDWEGLRSSVELSPLENKDAILDIIDRFQSDTEREAAIRNLDRGRTYGKLLKDYYPRLRRTTFNFRFDVRPYTIEELPEIFAAKPECLSLYEMYQLAEQYKADGKNPLLIYEKAYEMFPTDAVAALNYANALLKYGKDADGALRVLDAIKDDGRVFFPMAVAYDMKGDWREAERLLREAVAREDVRAKACKVMWQGN